jgi:hypothetical protein
MGTGEDEEEEDEFLKLDLPERKMSLNKPP